MLDTPAMSLNLTIWRLEVSDRIRYWTAVFYLLLFVWSVVRYNVAAFRYKDNATECYCCCGAVGIFENSRRLANAIHFTVYSSPESVSVLMMVVHRLINGLSKKPTEAVRRQCCRLANEQSAAVDCNVQGANPGGQRQGISAIRQRNCNDIQNISEPRGNFEHVCGAISLHYITLQVFYTHIVQVFMS